MKMIALLIAAAVATPAIAQDTTTPATPTAPAAESTTTYPPCSATVTDQCIERGTTHGHHYAHKKHK